MREELSRELCMPHWAESGIVLGRFANLGFVPCCRAGQDTCESGGGTCHAMGREQREQCGKTCVLDYLRQAGQSTELTCPYGAGDK